MSNESTESPELDFDALFFGEQAADEGKEKDENIQGGQPAPQNAQQDGQPEGNGGADAPDTGVEGGGTDDAKPGANATPTDDWANKYKELEDRYNALHGRLAPTQRQLSELQVRLQQMEQQRAQPAQTPAQRQEVTDSFFDSDHFKSWEEKFPGDAKILRDAIESERRASRGAIEQLNETVNGLAQRLERTELVTTRTEVNEETKSLSTRHPDWQKHDESGEFWEWFSNEWRVKQPKSLRAMYYDEGQVQRLFNDADFLADRLDEFKAEKGYIKPDPEPEQKPTQQVDSTQAQEPGDPRLDLSVAPDVRGHGQVPRGMPLQSLSEAEQFEALMRQVDPNYR